MTGSHHLKQGQPQILTTAVVRLLELDMAAWLAQYL